MEHLDTSGEMYPAAVCKWENRYAILPLANLVLSVPANFKVQQIRAGRDFTKKNLIPVGECEPETFTSPAEMRARYAERIVRFRKKFTHD